MEGQEGLLPLENILETDNGNVIMTAQAAPLVRKDRLQKTSAQQKTNKGGSKNLLYVVSEHSLFRVFRR
jgi:hypothetical protein